MRSIRATVLGVVQGVNFRYYTWVRARELGVAGWVRNLPDGSVEVRAQGPEEAVVLLEEWLHTGPATAYVRDVALSAAEPDPALATFEIRR